MEPKALHKLLLYGADTHIEDSKGQGCKEYLDQIEDGDLKAHCEDLLINIGKFKRKNQGLFKGKLLKLCPKSLQIGSGRSKAFLIVFLAMFLS